jgi:hypothetical protein
MTIRSAVIPLIIATWTLCGGAEEPPAVPMNINPDPIAEDASIRYDYDIVYVRSPRWVQDRGRKRPARWAEFAHIFNVTPGSDLVLLRPDGSEEVLVEGGAGAIQDPYVSFDGEWVLYTRFHKATQGPNSEGADIYKIHVPTRKIVRLTRQKFELNRPGLGQRYGVYNMHPCPLQGGGVAFVSSRNGFLPPPKSYPQVTLQLHRMDGDGSNIETIGHLNMAGALHPVILADGRLIFSSLENMGLRNYILWGIWSIHPDGTNWAPFVSALHGHSSPSSWHFQTQLSDHTVVVELYYNQNQKGFGPLFTLPPKPPEDVPGFGPGDLQDERNAGWKFVFPRGDKFELRPSFRFPFTPHGMRVITPWIRTNDFPAWPVNPAEKESTRIGKFTHPCGAPDNHLLVSWTLGPIGGSAGATKDWMKPQPIDAGLYLVKDGAITYEPGQMLKIRNEPDYNESWPRPLVSYKRLYGIDEPAILEHGNDGKLSEHLPEGTPFGLVGTSSFYKRETVPMGRVEEGSVTATFPNDYRGRSWDRGDNEYVGTIWNWQGQGADAGRYSNDEIHAVRILAFEPNVSTDAEGSRHGYPAYSNHPMERLRILGEVPLRKFDADSNQPLDPDSNPDTSFLARIPADVPFTFQTIDKDAVGLNFSQTWHQLRPGEVRNNCGGCHAHSQRPTEFALTSAAKPEYELFDLVNTTPLVTSKAKDESGRRWDAKDETGLRYVEGPGDVEYFRDIQPILNRSCAACHSKSLDKPASGLVLDDDATEIDGLPGTYFRLAADKRARFSPRRVEMRRKEGQPDEYIVRELFQNHMSSHYVWNLQARRSLLAWKVFGRRMDGWSDDLVETKFLKTDDPRRKGIGVYRGELQKDHRLYLGDIDFGGEEMPPPEAIAGTWKDPDGKTIKVPALSDEEKRTIARWIDLGCPIDLDPNYDHGKPAPHGDGYVADDTRPTLTLTWPMPGNNHRLDRILVGMHDYYSGLNMDSFKVKADFAIDGIAPGENQAGRFKEKAQGVWEYRFDKPISDLERSELHVSIQDKRGNVSRVVRAFSVGSRAVAPK